MTSKKHGYFVAEPMGFKPVTDIPGIGPVYGERFKNAGILFAYHLYGHFLTLDQNQQAFIAYMNQVVAANSYQASVCFNALHMYCQQYQN